MFERKNNRESHSWVEERLSAFMDNQLSPLERAQVDRHLRECKECQRALASLQWTISLLKQAQAPALPRSFMLPVPKQAPRAPIIGLSLLRFGTAMATLLLISLIGIDLFLQFGNTGMSATSFAPRIAVAPSAAPPTMPASDSANAEAGQDGFRAATAAPMLKDLAVPTPAATTAPPAVAPLPAAPATAAPPTVARKATLPPAPTSAPAATAAPFAGALQSQTGAPSRPSVRSSVAQGSPTPSILPGVGRGGGSNEKSSQDSTATTAATAAPLQSQPQSLAIEPTATPGATATETPSPPPATPAVMPVTPAATATPRREALVRPATVPATEPTAASPTENALPISPLRIAELGVLFVAVFLGVLTLLLRR